MKGKTIGYWVCTGLVVFFMLPGGIFYLMRAPGAVDGMRHLGIPLWMVVLLGVWKVLGSIALVVPKFPLLKEWAYAGIFFDLTGAVVADAANFSVWWHIAAPVSILLLLYGSWALRPARLRLVAAG